MTVDAPVKEINAADSPTASARSAKPKLSARLSASILTWFVVLAFIVDTGAGFFIARNNSNAHQEKLDAFFNSDMRADLILVGSSVAMASSHTADRELGYVSASVPRANYLGLKDLADQIFERTGKRFSAANLFCFGSMTSDTRMIVAKTVEFKKTPKVAIYQTVSRDLFDASMAPIDESPYIRYLSSIHPKTQLALLPQPLVKLIDQLQHSRLSTAVCLVFDDEQLFTNPERWRKHIDSILHAFSNLYGNRLAICAKLAQAAGSILHKETSSGSASLAAKIENKKKNPFAALSDAAPGTFRVDETPQIRRYEQERLYFSKLLKLCKQNHIQLVIVNMPAQAAYKKLIPFGLRKICPMETYAQARESGFAVIDMDRPDIFTPDNFVDIGHLNAKGALKLNRLLARELADRHILDQVPATQ